MARKGQFKKGGGRVGGGGSSKRKSKGGGALVVVDQYATPQRVYRPTAARRRSRRHHHHAAPTHHRKRRRKGSSSSGGLTLKRVGIAAVALANIAGTNSGVLGAHVYDQVQKLPGAKTFGGAATAGVYIGAIEKFTGIGGGFRPWMRAAGFVGLVLAAAKLGEVGTNFKWLGDPGPNEARSQGRGRGDQIMDVDTD